MAVSKGKRHEIKYTINYLEYMTYHQRLRQVLEEDHSEQGQGYDVTSIYFDDIYNTAFLQKVRGDAFRYKYRLRYYNDSHEHYKLENKEKWHQMTVKSSTLLSDATVQKILAGDYEILDADEDPLVQDFYSLLKTGTLKPKTVIRYHRNAYLHPVGGLRVTFDTDVRFALFKTGMEVEDMMFIPAISPDEAIMEIKFNGVLPCVVEDLIQASKTMSSSSSKYVYSRILDYNY